MKKEFKLYAWVYPYRMLLGAILEFYNSVIMYLGLTHNIRKNKVNVDLEFLFLLHVHDVDRCDGFGNTAIEKFS